MGISLVVDATLGESVELRDALRAQEIPYFSFDYSIQSHVKLMERYLRERGASEAVFILQDETTSDEAFYYFAMRSPMRTLILNRKNIERLRKLRPVPRYFALIGDTVSVEKMFQSVRCNLYGKGEALALKAFAR